jgi:PKD repeat protein
MERNEQDIFDQLVREKLSGYTEPPEPAWIKNIHAKKGRVMNLYHLYRLLLVTALVGAGIFASVQFVPYTNSIQSANTPTTPQGTFSSQSTDGQTTRYAVPSFGQSNTESSSAFNTALSGQYDPARETEKAITLPQTRKGNKVSNKPATGTKHALQPFLEKNATEVEQSYLIEAPKATNEDKQPILEQKDEPKEADKEGSDLSSNCDASFEYFTSYNGEINFSNTSTLTSKSNTTWTFGDGVASQEREPIHQYKTTGTYHVTLHIKDAKSGCEDQLTKTIAYKNPNDKTTPITISGELFAGTTLVKNGWVELYQYDSKKGGFVLSNTFRTTHSGAFSVNINRNVRYLLKGLPSDDLRDYTATFWGNTEYIENASEILVMPSEQDNLIGYNIELALGEQQPSDHNIKDPDATNTGQSVVLLDGNNNVVGIGKVDENGNYTFSGSLPPGDYKILNPATGIATSKTIAAGGNATISGSIFDKNEDHATGNVDEKVSVFPNPASNTVTFGINSSNEEKATIILMNAAGVELSRKQITFLSGFNQTQYDLTSYSPGIYYILVFKGNQQVLSNRLVKMADTSK